MFVTVTLNQSWICWDVPDGDGRDTRPSQRYAIAYPCSGVLADRSRHQAPGALAALREARLADHRRAGRSVLYYLASAGQVLLGAQGAGLDGC